MRTLSAYIGVLGLVIILSPGRGNAEGLGEIPRGVFSLQAAGQPVAGEVLADPSVDGISIRQKWRDLETSKGVYDWTFIDSEVARARQAGKKVLLRIVSEGKSTPSWVYNEGVQLFRFAGNGRFRPAARESFAIFWDPTYLAAKKAMIEAAGRHLAGNPTLRIVTAVPASARSGDWFVPHTAADLQHWYEVGYSSGKVIDVCEQIISVTMASFPRQYVALAVGQNGRLDPDPNYVARSAVQYAQSHFPGRLIVQKNSLSANSPPPGPNNAFHILWENRPNVAGQMLWFSFGDRRCRNNGGQGPCDPAATLRRAIDIGLSYGMKYIEVYERDIINLPEVVRYAHTALTK
jgi:Beta-galactosidase